MVQKDWLSTMMNRIFKFDSFQEFAGYLYLEKLGNDCAARCRGWRGYV